MRIAQIAPVAAPVRPGAGDSVEHLVSLLTEELVRRGHDVTLYATGDSETSAALRSVYARGYDEDPDEPWEWRYREIVHAAHAWEHAGDHDVLHLHDFHWGLPFAGLASTPAVETPHTELPPEVLEEYRRQERVHVAAVSQHQARALTRVTRKSVVPHGIDVRAFPAGETPGDYLLFLGRLIPDKGPSEAIAIARAAGMPLVLAGPASAEYDPAADPDVDGEVVRWVGRVDAEQRNRLLAGAAALVFPLRYPEPFGLVVIEAMACGTPVLATALGAIPELVEDGVTGFTAPTWSDLAELVAAARTLDRGVIRRVAEERWDFRRMVDDYEALYRELAS